MQEIYNNGKKSFYHPTHPSNFLGFCPVARYLAAMSSVLRICSPRLASTMAFFSSASLCIKASLFFNFSAYSAFFCSNLTCRLQQYHEFIVVIIHALRSI